jgi:asparagine synthase (glutamine-hydrolysing)
MCGFVGVVAPNPSSLFGEVNKGLAMLEHRGPDYTETINSSKFAFGHNRLSIIELSNEAHQPFVSLDGRFVIVFNGEIYNYEQLRDELILAGIAFKSKSDTEVVVEAYRLFGIDSFARFRGMFSFVIWDHYEENVLIVRDSFGEKPLLYKYENDELFFASEMKAFTVNYKDRNEFNLEAIDLFLHYQFIPEPRTMVNKVSKLQPGHFLIYSPAKKELLVTQYLDLFAVNEQSSIETSRKTSTLKLKDLIYSAVERCLVADVPVSVALSAGIDSSSIAALCKEIQGRATAISIGYPGRPPYDERAEAEKFAQEKGIEFHEVEISTVDFVSNFQEFVWKMDEPIADPAAYAHYMVPKKARELGFKILISGIGGDELFWGYSWLKNAILKNEQMLNPVNAIMKGFERNFRHKNNILEMNMRDVITSRKYLHFYEQVEDFNKMFKEKKSFYSDNMKKLSWALPLSVAGHHPLDPLSIPTCVAKALSQTWLNGNCLTISDRLGMANSVEIRSPYLDIDLAMFAFSLNRSIKMHEMGPKEILKDALKDILPSYVLERNKTGFQPPVTEWQRGVIDEYSSLFKGGYLVEAGVVRKEFFSSMNNSKEADNKVRQNTIYKLLILEIWMRRFGQEINAQ